MLFGFLPDLYSQKTNNTFYVEPSYMVGKVVPNYIKNFPNTSLQHAINIDVGIIRKDTSNLWAKYYNYPKTGVSFFASTIGNNKIFGSQIAILPYISFDILKKKKGNYSLKLGLGASYFTTHYHPVENDRNLDIGSPYTWAFQSFLYKDIYHKKGVKLKLGAGYSHASNGHTQLPNLGLNSALVSLSAQFNNQEVTSFNPPPKSTSNNTQSYSVSLEKGLGFHEFGSKDFPIGGEKHLVEVTSLSVGRISKKHYKIKAGLTHRFYNSYHNYIIDSNELEYIDHARKNASNIELFLGNEFYLGHVDIDIRLGFNLYKPFYKRFNELFPERTAIEQKLKSLITTRLGLNLFLINTNKLPKHNLYFGTYIKANVDQADFTAVSVGYTYRLK
jgi:hypothetical protein